MFAPWHAVQKKHRHFTAGHGYWLHMYLCDSMCMHMWLHAYTHHKISSFCLYVNKYISTWNRYLYIYIYTYLIIYDIWYIICVCVYIRMVMDGVVSLSGQAMDAKYEVPGAGEPQGSACLYGKIQRFSGNRLVNRCLNGKLTICFYEKCST